MRQTHCWNINEKMGYAVKTKLTNPDIRLEIGFRRLNGTVEDSGNYELDLVALSDCAVPRLRQRSWSDLRVVGVATTVQDIRSRSGRNQRTIVKVAPFLLPRVARIRVDQLYYSASRSRTVADWTREKALRALKSIGIEPSGERPIQNAVQLVLPGGTKVNVFHNGNLSFGGPATDEKARVEALLKPQASASVNTLPPSVPSTSHSPSAVAQTSHGKVFIVYGHDAPARKSLAYYLMRWKIEPVVLGDLAPDGKTIVEALESHDDVKCAIILLTSDDVGCAKNDSPNLKPRARQNAILELGLFWGRFGRERVTVVMQEDVEVPSDINNLIRIQYKNSIDEVAVRIAAALQKHGFHISAQDMT